MAVLQTDKLDAVADRGYFNGFEILACDRAGIAVTLPKPMTSGAKLEGRFGKQDFVYLPKEDVYRCPAGERLTFHYVNEENGQKPRRYWTNACGTCAIKHRCTTGKERRITRWGTSMYWTRRRGVSTRILRPCASAARRSSTRSARSRCGWARRTSCGTVFSFDRGDEFQGSTQQITAIQGELFQARPVLLMRSRGERCEACRVIAP